MVLNFGRCRRFQNQYSKDCSVILAVVWVIVGFGSKITACDKVISHSQNNLSLPSLPKLMK